MKNLTTLVLFSYAALICTGMIAQDVITYKNGNEKQVKVIEVWPTEVKYKSFTNLDGPLYSDLKSDIFMIKYENGLKDVFNSTTKEVPIVVSTPAADPKQLINCEQKNTSLDGKNLDMIVMINGDTINCYIHFVSATSINYSVFRRGADTRSAEIPLKHVSKYYKNKEASAIGVGANSGPINTTEVKPLHIVKEEPALDDDEFLPEVRKYGGPRVGMTYACAGAYRDLLYFEGKRPMYSQFGWQMEKRLFTTKTGISGMVEFVPMVGGIDMGKFIPSASALIGIRLKNGIEVGAGPNAAVYGYRNEKNYMITTTNFGIVIAAGFSFKSDKVYFPVNIVFVPSVGKKARYMDPSTGTWVEKKYETGAKISLLVGFNYRKR